LADTDARCSAQQGGSRWKQQSPLRFAFPAGTQELLVRTEGRLLQNDRCLEPGPAPAFMTARKTDVPGAREGIPARLANDDYRPDPETFENLIEQLSPAYHTPVL
jgi:hypothetical protein